MTNIKKVKLQTTPNPMLVFSPTLFYKVVGQKINNGLKLKKYTTIWNKNSSLTYR